MPQCICSRAECPEQGFTFRTERELNEHWRLTADHPFCASCSNRFRDQAALDQHMATRHPYCALDETYFSSKEAFRQHCVAKHTGSYCADCQELFDSEAGRREHYRKTAPHVHAACNVCAKGFRTAEHLLGHYRSKADVEHPVCVVASCSAGIFVDKDDLFEHYRENADSHYYCGQCDVKFGNLYALEQHLDAAAVHKETNKTDLIATHFLCVPCNRAFPNEPSLRQHLATNTSHNYCFICSKDFEWEAALQAHNKSFAHAPRNIECPMGCGKLFSLRSAEINHLSSGHCSHAPELGNRHINAAAKAAGVPGVINSESVQRTVSPSTIPHQGTISIATERLYNPVKGTYECFLCDGEFMQLLDINQHLISSVHDRPYFRCSKKGCNREFKQLAAYFLHWEVEFAKNKKTSGQNKKQLGVWTEIVIRNAAGV